MYILVLEISTSSAKAMLYHAQTGEMEFIKEANTDANMIAACPNPEELFLQVVSLGKKLSASKNVAIIALSGTWHSVLVCDQQMKPVTGLYNWNSNIAADLCEAKRKDEEYVNAYYHKTGCMVSAIYPFFKLLSLQAQGLDLSDKYIMGQGSYITYRLVGQRLASDCMASGTGLMNIHTKEYDEKILAEAGISRASLPQIHSYERTHPLTAAGAKLLGLKAGIPVISACSDGGLNQIGIGAEQEGIMSFSVGTSAAIRLNVNKPLLPKKPSVWCYLSPTNWLSGAATSGATNCTSWLRRKYFPAEKYSAFEPICAQRDDAPIFLPFIYGERCPGWNDKALGQFLDVQPSHDKYDMYRAVMEGVLFNLYQCYQILCRVNNLKPKIILSGGILNSPEWTQMCADIFGSDLKIPSHEQSSLLGAVVLGLRVLGQDESQLTFLKEFTSVKHQPARHTYFKKRFQRYLYWYNKQRV